MTRIWFLLTLTIAVALAVWGGRTVTAQDAADGKYVPHPVSWTPAGDVRVWLP
jgi:hypothetical protein